MTQAQLAEGICSQSEISLIEKGEREPSFSKITLLCEKLNISTDYLLRENFEEKLDIETIISNLEQSIFFRDYKAMGVFLDDQNLWSSTFEPSALQSLLYYKGIYLSLYKNDQNAAIDVLNTALLETNSSVNKDFFFSLQNKNFLSKNETLILAAIGSCYFLKTDYLKADEYFKVASNNIEILEFQNETENLAIIYYSASKNLKYLKKYEEALLMALEGFKWISKKFSAYRLPELLYEIAENHKFLSNHTLAEKYYIKSLTSAYSLGNNLLLELMLDEYRGIPDMTFLQQQIIIIESLIRD